MRCDCCGRRKRLFESYEKVEPNINVCVECSTLLYKIRDAEEAGKREETLNIESKLKKKMTNKATREFEKWYRAFRNID